MELYMEGLSLGVNTMYMLFYFFKLFRIGCIGLNNANCHWVMGDR